jgi:hypothetical protein
LSVVLLGAHCSPAVGEEACGGDCNQDGVVTVDELVRGIGIALGTPPLAACRTADADNDQVVTIDEILSAVIHALDGCPLRLTPSLPPTPSPTPTPIATRTRAAWAWTAVGQLLG